MPHGDVDEESGEGEKCQHTIYGAEARTAAFRCRPSRVNPNTPAALRSAIRNCATRGRYRGGAQRAIPGHAFPTAYLRAGASTPAQTATHSVSRPPGTGSNPTTSSACQRGRDALRAIGYAGRGRLSWRSSGVTARPARRGGPLSVPSARVHTIRVGTRAYDSGHLMKHSNEHGSTV
jgi:hypothetical protein